MVDNKDIKLGTYLSTNNSFGRIVIKIIDVDYFSKYYTYELIEGKLFESSYLPNNRLSMMIACGFDLAVDYIRDEELRKLGL